MRLGNDLFFAEIERLLGEGSEVRFRIHGFSMRPLLRDRIDRVTIRRHRPHEIAKGAILLFRHGGAYAMHRVKACAGSEVILAGDGNCGATERARCEDIIAIAVSIARPAGKVINCSDRRLRIASAAWLMLPPFARRCILGITKRLKT